MKKAAIGFVLILILLSAAAFAWQATYDVPWWTVDGGAETSRGGEFALSGIIGQPDAGVLAGGGYTLGGGFWRGGATSASYHRVYLPVVLRGY